MSMTKKQRREYKAAVRARRDDAKAFKLAREAESRERNDERRRQETLAASAASAPAPAADTLP